MGDVGEWYELGKCSFEVMEEFVSKDETVQCFSSSSSKCILKIDHCGITNIDSEHAQSIATWVLNFSHENNQSSAKNMVTKWNSLVNALYTANEFHELKLICEKFELRSGIQNANVRIYIFIEYENTANTHQKATHVVRLLDEIILAKRFPDTRAAPRKWFHMESILSDISSTVKREKGDEYTGKNKVGDMKLELFPDEIILKIASFLASGYYLSQLENTCKRFRRLLRHTILDLNPNTNLYEHQKLALSWMLDRENHATYKRELDLQFYELIPMRNNASQKRKQSKNKPFLNLLDGTIVRLAKQPVVRGFAGGLLCDDPGLGKTVTAIGLILKTRFKRARVPFSASSCVDKKWCYTNVRSDEHESLVSDEESHKEFADLSLNRRRSNRSRKTPDFLSETKGKAALPVFLQASNNERIINLSFCTLVVVPTALVEHWLQQFDQHVAHGSDLRVLIVENGYPPSEYYLDPELLANHIDVVLMSVDFFRREYESLRTGESPLSCVHFKRLILDEGHQLGELSGIGMETLMVECIIADSRWILTGTPSSSRPGADIAQFWPLLHAIQEKSFGCESAFRWESLCVRPIQRQSVIAREQLRVFLDRIVFRNKKNTMSHKLPKLEIHTERLRLNGETALNYDHLVRLLKRNLLLCDFFDESHEESLLNPKLSSVLRQFLDNLRKSCSMTGHIKLALSEKEMQEVLDEFAEIDEKTLNVHARFSVEQNSPMRHKMMHVSEDEAVTLTEVYRKQSTLHDEQLAQQVKQDEEAQISVVDGPSFVNSECIVKPGFYVGSFRYEGDLARIGNALLNGSNCEHCKEFTYAPLISHCRHVICVECASRSKLKCMVCGCAFKIGKKGEPVDFIEIQPAYTQSIWHSLYETKIGTKMEYLLRRLKEISLEPRMSADGTLKLPHKVLIFTEFALYQTVIKAQLTANNVKCDAIHHRSGRKGRAETIKKFKEGRECNVLVFDKSGTVGHDLSFVTYVFLMEPVWNRQLELQVISRAHRIGAKETVRVERLVASGSIEEQLLNLSDELHGDIDTKVDFNNGQKSMRSGSGKELEMKKLNKITRELTVIGSDSQISLSDHHNEEIHSSFTATNQLRSILGSRTPFQHNSTQDENKNEASDQAPATSRKRVRFNMM